jgi:hypothetical protein
VPLLAADRATGALGAMYFALDAPCEIENIQDTLLVGAGCFLGGLG